MGRHQSWQPSELGQAARDDASGQMSSYPGQAAGQQPSQLGQIGQVPTQTAVGQYPPGGSTVPKYSQYPQHAAASAHSQMFWLAIGFVMSLVAALILAGGILAFTHLNGGNTLADTPKAASTQRMAPGDSVGTKTGIPSGSDSLTSTPSTHATHEAEKPRTCGINGVGDAANPCPTTPANLPEAGDTEAGQATSPAPEGSAATTGTAALPPVKACDGATVVAPGNGRLNAAQLRLRFETIASNTGAKIAVAWYDPQYGLVTAGAEGGWPAWSTSKVPLAVAVSQAGKAAEFKDSIRQAITVSDNDAADRLWRGVADTDAQRAEAVTKVIRQSGDRNTVVPSTRRAAGFSIFGQTEWTPLNQVRFAATLPCQAQAGGVIEQMRYISPSQRWGMGRLPGATFKGGWGPSEGIYTVRQFGWYQDRSGNRVFIAMATQAGSMGAGTTVLDELSQILQ